MVAVGIFLCLFAGGCDGEVTAATKGYEALLAPELNAGTAGWCLAVTPEGGCTAIRSRLPIVAETWSRSEGVSKGFAITTSAVRAVSVRMVSNSPSGTIATRAAAVLPAGLRRVGVEIHEGRRLGEAGPQFVPLDGNGNVIYDVRGQNDIATEVAIRNVPSSPAVAVPCRLVAEPMSGLALGGGSVVTAVKAYGGLIGEGFISCTSSSYNLDGWPLLAAVLLNAAKPGAPPRPLPGMTPVAGHPGVFRAPSPEGTDIEKQMLARRVAGAWVVVARAKFKQRLTLLERLRVSLHL